MENQSFLYGMVIVWTTQHLDIDIQIQLQHYLERLCEYKTN